MRNDGEQTHLFQVGAFAAHVRTRYEREIVVLVKVGVVLCMYKTWEDFFKPNASMCRGIYSVVCMCAHMREEGKHTEMKFSPRNFSSIGWRPIEEKE